MKIGLIPRFTDIFFILLFLSALAAGPKMLNIDGDLPRHLLMGKIVLENVSPPTQELFSYVYEGRPYVSHEWLAGVIYYLSYAVLGLNGVVLLASLLIASTFTILHWQATVHNGRIFLNFLLVFMGAMVTSIHWITRPHLFTMLFLAIWLIWMDRWYCGEPVKLWIFPALMLVWTNMHAESIAGFLVILAYIAGWSWQFMFSRTTADLAMGRKLLIIALLSFLASLFNPAGLRTWETLLNYINNNYLMSRITETRPPDFARPEYLPLLILLGLSIVILAIRKDKFTPAQIILMAGFGAMALLSARNAHLFGIVAAYTLSSAFKEIKIIPPLRRIEAVLERMEGQASGKGWPVIVTILVSVVLLGVPYRNFNRFEPSVFPVDAVRWLENNPHSGRMFNAFDWGGYILFHLWPEQKVFIESQTDLDGELTQKYEAIVTLRGNWQEIFNEYNITWAIIPPQWPLTQTLKDEGWEIIYKDQTAVILTRK